jgi:hypothetical protein
MTAGPAHTRRLPADDLGDFIQLRRRLREILGAWAPDTGGES